MPADFVDAPVEADPAPMTPECYTGGAASDSDGAAALIEAIAMEDYQKQIDEAEEAGKATAAVEGATAEWDVLNLFSDTDEEVAMHVAGHNVELEGIQQSLERPPT